MPQARSNGITLEYESIGDVGAPPMLLVMGFSVQMIQWPDGFLAQLAARGFRLIRFDNRDVGLSSKVERAYSLNDMAADAAGLLDALGLESAHVVGASMGGFIAQLMSIRHAPKVRSLCSIMSSTGSTQVGQPKPEMFAALMTPAPPDRDAYIAVRMNVARRVAGPGFPFNEQRIRDTICRAFDRCYYPAGAARQIHAVMTAGDRTRLLAGVRAPTLVIHGTDDPLVDVSGGEATARAIPGARFLPIAGMGHDLPEGAWPTIIDAIVANASA